jgi:hypothetical protein
MRMTAIHPGNRQRNMQHAIDWFQVTEEALS